MRHSVTITFKFLVCHRRKKKNQTTGIARNAILEWCSWTIDSNWGLGVIIISREGTVTEKKMKTITQVRNAD